MVAMIVDLIQINVWNVLKTFTMKLNQDVAAIIFKNAMIVLTIQITAAIVKKTTIHKKTDTAALEA